MMKHPNNGYLYPFYIKGIPVLIHWSFPAGGIFLAFMLGDTSLDTVISLIIAYTLLIIVHEFGHAFAAKLYSLKVHAVLITASGGWCYADIPTTISSKLFFYGGGLIAQLLLLAITIVLLLVFGSPSSTIINSFALVFTIINALMIAINIYPSKGTDGKHLWSILSGQKQKA